MKNPGPKEEKPLDEILDEEVDEADEESFPASDPPAWTTGIDPDEVRADNEPTDDKS